VLLSAIWTQPWLNVLRFGVLMVKLIAQIKFFGKLLWQDFQ